MDLRRTIVRFLFLLFFAVAFGLLSDLVLTDEKAKAFGYPIAIAVFLSLLSTFTESKAKALFDDKLINPTLAVIFNDTFAYSTICTVDIPENIYMTSIRDAAMKMLQDKGKQPKIDAFGGNYLYIQLNQPATTIAISLTSQEIDEDEDDSTKLNQVIVTTLEPVTLIYQQRFLFDEYVVLLSDLSNFIQQKFAPNSESPELRVTVNRLSSRTAPHRPHPPMNVLPEVKPDVTIYRDSRSLQVFSHDSGAIGREVRRDVSNLEPA
jgi:hypothetical protein